MLGRLGCWWIKLRIEGMIPISLGGRAACFFCAPSLLLGRESSQSERSSWLYSRLDRFRERPCSVVKSPDRKERLLGEKKKFCVRCSAFALMPPSKESRLGRATFDVPRATWILFPSSLTARGLTSGSLESGVPSSPASFSGDWPQSVDSASWSCSLQFGAGLEGVLGRWL